MANSLTHRYIPRIEQTQENLFIEEYYSGTDVKIYIDDAEQTEIAQISYTVQEQLKPLFGYASHTFDDVAIGNRIVAGSFSVPIKNPESQSTMEEIVQYHGFVAQDYNDKQSDLMDAIDWITNMQYSDSFDVNTGEDDITFEYRTKLIKLGYNLDYNSSLYVFRQQLKQFQQDYNLEISGNLDSNTQAEIDKALKKTTLEKFTVPANTKLYIGPSSGFSYTVLGSMQDVFILEDEYQGGWLHVMTKDGQEGFINTHEVAKGW